MKLQSIEKEAAACRKAFKGYKGRTAIHVHHAVLAEELTEPAENRIAYILSDKPEREQALRLRLFRPAPWLDAALAEYGRVQGAALAEYGRVKGPALAEYERVKGPAWAEYGRVKGAAWAEYKRVEGPAWAEYGLVQGAAWAEYERVKGPALAEYKRVEGVEHAKHCKCGWNGKDIFGGNS